MRKASLVLGIISSVFALLLAVIVIGLSASFISTMSDDGVRREMREAYDEIDGYEDIYGISLEKMEMSLNIGGYAILGTGISSFVSFLFALVGSILVKKKNVLAGILLLVGALFSFLSIWGFLTAILLVLAGIFALVRDKSVMQEPQSV